MLLFYINYFFNSVKLIQQIKLHLRFKKTPVVRKRPLNPIPIF